MQLYELIKNIEKIAQITHVNDSFIGDIYELNKRQDINYPCFVLTQGTHSYNNDDETNIYNLSLFLVDRLLEDKSNETDVQNWAYSGIREIIRTLEVSGISSSIHTTEINTFTERFNSLCAGAFGNLLITIDNDCVCCEPRFVTSVNGQTGDVYIKGAEGDYVETKDFKKYKTETAHELEDIKESIPTIPNFKTINGESIIGEGDIEVEGGVSYEEFDSYKEETESSIDSLNNDLTNKADKSEIPDVSNFATKDELTNKQDTLESGVNIKTINGESILGEGNIEIQGGGGDVTREEFDQYKEATASTLNNKQDKSFDSLPIVNFGYAATSEIKAVNTFGVSNYNCLERYHNFEPIGIEFSMRDIVDYYGFWFMNIKAFMRQDGEYAQPDFKLTIFDANGNEWDVSQFIEDKHVYGAYSETSGYTERTTSSMIDSRDGDDYYATKISDFLASRQYLDMGIYVRNGKTIYTPNSMEQVEAAFNEASTDYYIHQINIKYLIEYYRENIKDDEEGDNYYFLRVNITSTTGTDWLIMSQYVKFTNDFVRVTSTETSIEDEFTKRPNYDYISEALGNKMDYVAPTFRGKNPILYQGIEFDSDSIGAVGSTGSVQDNVVERWHSTSKCAVKFNLYSMLKKYLDEGFNYAYIKTAARCESSSTSNIFLTSTIYDQNGSIVTSASKVLNDRIIYGNRNNCMDYYELEGTAIIDSRDPYGWYAIDKDKFSIKYNKPGIGDFSCPNSRWDFNQVCTVDENYRTKPYFANCIDLYQLNKIIKIELGLDIEDIQNYTIEFSANAPNKNSWWLMMSMNMFFGNYNIRKDNATGRPYNLDYNLQIRPTKTDIATINGQSLIYGGNIEIQGGGDVSRDEFDQLKEQVDNIELVKSPNVTIFGTPTIQNGQISDFSNDNYAQFPFLLDIGGRPYDIRFSFTTGDSVEGQQNILDSNYGIALAVRNGVIVFNASNNGYEWNGEDGQEIIVYENIQPDTTYYIEIVRPQQDVNYFYIYLYSDRFETQIAYRFVWFLNFYPRQILIGRSYADNVNHFTGSINLNDASISINGELMWQGMDDVGLSTRLSTDMANLDDAGKEVINQMIDNKIGVLASTLNTILGDE